MLYLINFNKIEAGIEEQQCLIDLEETNLDDFIIDEADSCGYLDADTVNFFLTILNEEQKEEVLENLNFEVFKNAQARLDFLKRL